MAERHSSFTVTDINLDGDGFENLWFVSSTLLHIGVRLIGDGCLVHQNQFRKEVMKMSEELLSELLGILVVLQKELHGKVDDSVTQKLEEAILTLQRATDGKLKINPKKVLILIGSIFELISSIKSIIENLK